MGELKDRSIQELKAMAYDRIAMIEAAQRELGLINQAISEKLKEPEKAPQGHSNPQPQE
jgi:hypothetical protein